jgi:uncharacterized Zn finger protein
MAQFSKTWWGKRFIEALEEFTDPARLGRGRSYARNDKIKEYQIKDGQIVAKVRGSINPYFGVYKEPLYTTRIEIKPISAASWTKAIALLSSRASWVTKLLMNEMPDDIDEALTSLNINLLPHRRSDFKTSCSCPDYSNPCKHIAGVHYLIASQLDQDPFTLFELRGLPRQQLQAELAKSPLGKALSDMLNDEELAIEPANAYYPELKEVSLPKQCSAHDFWLGEKRLPQTIEPATESSIPAIVVKKGGAYPPFWHQDRSFIIVMEELYARVRANSKKML